MGRGNLMSKILKKGGEKEMKNLTLFFAVVWVFCLLALPTTAKAIDIGVRAEISGGASLPAPVIVKCDGSRGTINDPFTSNYCVANLASINFGNLTTQLYDTNGNPTAGADCFYAKDYFIVYLYPDSWGGKGYELKSQGYFTDPDFQKAVTFTPVYSEFDAYDLNGDGDTTDPGEGPQGAMNAQETSWNPNINKAQLANGGPYTIFKSNRPRIVQAHYAIPPRPGAGQSRPTGWQPLPLTKAAGIYYGTITITLTEW